MDTDSDFEMESTYDDVLRKIGRNLLLFQQAEHLINTLSLRGTLRAPGKDAGDRREALVLIVEEQGRLVHHILPDLMPDTLENYRNLSRNLDSQREKVLPAIHRLLDDGTSMRHRGGDLPAIFQNPDPVEHNGPYRTGSGFHPRFRA